MDRDTINCLHYLYQWGKIPNIRMEELDPGKRIFWCPPDMSHPLFHAKIISERKNHVFLNSGVYNLLSLTDAQLRSMPKSEYAFGYPFSNPIRSKGEVRPAFLAIPYAPAFEQVKKTVLEAAGNTGFHCEVTGDLSNPGDIMDQVWQGIRGADAVIADISGNNPNVFYEIGLAHALGKGVIIISGDAMAPFDIQSSRRITYNPENLSSLKSELEDALRSIPARYPHEEP